MSQNALQKKRSKHVVVVRGEKGWEGRTPWDRGIMVMWFGKGKPFIPYGQEEAAQDNAWLSNKKIIFDDRGSRE